MIIISQLSDSFAPGRTLRDKPQDQASVMGKYPETLPDNSSRVIQETQGEKDVDRSY